MNRKQLSVLVVGIILVICIAIAIPLLLQPHPGRQVGYIPPAPPSAAPPIITLTPPPSVTLERPTWTPIPSTSTPTATVKPSSTATAVSISPTPMGPDRDTRGDSPVTQPVTGGAPVTVTPELLASLFGIALSLVLSYVPRVRERYEALEPDYKRAVAGAGIVLIGLGVALFSCAGWADWMVCSQVGLLGMASNIIYALMANQATFLISPKRAMKAQADDLAMVEAMFPVQAETLHSGVIQETTERPPLEFDDSDSRE